MDEPTRESAPGSGSSGAGASETIARMLGAVSSGAAASEQLAELGPRPSGPVEGSAAKADAVTDLIAAHTGQGGSGASAADVPAKKPQVRLRLPLPARIRRPIPRPALRIPRPALHIPRTRRLRLSRRRSAVAIGMVVAAALLFFGGGMLLGGSPAATPLASPAAQVSPSTGSSPAATPGTVTTAATSEPTEGEPLPAQLAPTASITFNGIVVRTASRAPQPLSFRFVSDGPGPVSVSVVGTATIYSTKVCLSGDGGTPICSTGGTPSASFYSRSNQSSWTATLVSTGESDATLDLALSWPANKPSVDVAHASFLGGPNPDSVRSLTASVTARAGGPLSVTASWSPAVLSVSLTLSKQSGSTWNRVAQTKYERVVAMPAAYRMSVKAEEVYRVTLMDLSDAISNEPELAATIAFP